MYYEIQMLRGAIGVHRDNCQIGWTNGSTYIHADIHEDKII